MHEVRHGLADLGRAVPVWLCSVALALLVSDVTPLAVGLPAAIAFAVAVVGSRWAASRRVAAACSLLAAAALDPAAALPWILAAVALTAVVNERAPTVAEPALGELDRSLERCRRRGEPAAVVFLDMASEPAVLSRLMASARISDSLVVRSSETRVEVFGLLEGCDLERANVAERFEQALGGTAAFVGWSSYPSDGLTLDALLKHARNPILSEPSRTARAARDAPRVQPGIEQAEPERA